jgi:hypothetical protein
MPRDNHRSAQTRLLIARRAAELMAEHGIQDHTLAKRKAARQLGLPPNHDLPSNDEVDRELVSHQALFDPEDPRLALAEARRKALEVMRLLARFSPVLTGRLALGIWARYTDMEFEVYADSSKEFERFLLDQGIEFKTEERREGSYFTLYGEPADIRVRILPAHMRQSGPRDPDEPRRRLGIEEIGKLVDSATGESTLTRE